jgi:hypothetical protein
MQPNVSNETRVAVFVVADFVAELQPSLDSRDAKRS